jgi:hypothetical protein
MAQTPSKPVKPPTVGPTTLGSEYAPFIYFDGALTMGVNCGAIQLDLAANIIVPDADMPNGVRTDVVTTAHLRCSPNAANDLINALKTALEMVKNAAEQTPTAAAASKLN